MGTIEGPHGFLMRVLITGAEGQLGHDLVEHCAASGDHVSALDRGALDVGDRDQVLGVVMSSPPDVVFNTAAWTAVDACESDPDRAYRVNALGVRWLREACERAGAHLVQISTDYVFDGTLDRPYHEWDTPNPQSVYGASKLASEREVRPSDTVVRTSWVCGEHGSNMVKTVLRLLATHDSLSFVDDQVGCPTFSADIAIALRQLAVGRRPGIHHVTNQGAVSWYEFVGDIVVATGRSRDIVKPIATADLRPLRPAPRPANSVLDNTVLRLADLPLLRHYSEPLSELVKRILAS